jgi:SAM-dependent methyltransferase
LKWFRDRGAATATSAPAAEGAPPEPEVHPSLALPDLLHQLHPDRRLRILDLGPAVGANLDFLAALYPCTVQVADLYPSLAETGAGDPAAAIAAALPPAATQEPSLDLVLAWNLLDYLDRERIRSLAAHLARRCRPGALLFAMIGTRPEIPREPGSFVIRDPESLVYRQDPTRTRPGYRYRPRDIAGLTPGFNTDRNFLLRHGVQEYLLQREEDG